MFFLRELLSTLVWEGDTYVFPACSIYSIKHKKT
jgi:hypothetical protein